MGMLLTGTAAAAELPVFRPGLWEFDRTVNGQKVASKECLDPTARMKAQNAKLEQSGCSFSPMEKAGATYTFTSECAMKMPGGKALRSSSKSVMTVESDSAYRLQVTGTLAGEPSSEQLVARRIGECPR
jgi:hypothetical protein